MKRTERSRRGQVFVEAITAAFVLIPIALFALDLIVVVMANSMNDTAVKSAARAAANQKDSGAAQAAAVQALQSFHNSSIIAFLGLDGSVDYSGADAVTVKTKMVVNLPVPIPGYSQVTFRAADAEPIVYSPNM